MKFNSPLFSAFLWVSMVALSCDFGALAKDVGEGPSFKGPVGLQLYSLREQFRRTCQGHWTRCSAGASVT
jgi:hypothetical protein